MALSGPQLFVRYAFMPNQLGYCGGDDHRALFEYGLDGRTDGGLRELERGFEGAYPYLELIAAANRIADPLAARVVEAYWIGNDLLDRVDDGPLLASLDARFRSRLRPSQWRWLRGKQGARPHHSFHVLELYPRVGMLRSGAADHVIATMGQCCIRWGQVQEVHGPTLIVHAARIELANGRLALGEPRPEVVQRWVDGRGFVDDAVPGDWVAIHWGWACDRLSPVQRGRLAHYTQHHLALCNTTL